MKKYESFIIVAPTIDEEKQKEIENKYSELINENGKLESFNNLGKKMLAYIVKGNQYGIYMQWFFESTDNGVAEIESQYKNDDDVLKFIIVRTED